jgi:hypothetical protein
MDLNDLLAKAHLDAKRVLVFRHSPTERKLKKRLPWLAAERPEVFNAYQQTQGKVVEKAMLSASHVASFIGLKPGEALFAGLYAIGKSRPITQAQYWQVPAYQEMKLLGMKGFTEDNGRETWLWFDLTITDFYKSWIGKLVVHWPPPERVWYRRAHRNDFQVQAILDESAFVERMPQPNRLVLDWVDLSTLPSSWKAALRQWRGIYYIFDTSERKGYVGSAYGVENILGRWVNYSATGHGGNKLLKERDKQNFRFSILELVSPEMGAEDVVAIENSWKERLHTRQPYGLNEN